MFLKSIQKEKNFKHIFSNQWYTVLIIESNSYLIITNNSLFLRKEYDKTFIHIKFLEIIDQEFQSHLVDYLESKYGTSILNNIIFKNILQDIDDNIIKLIEQYPDIEKYSEWMQEI